MWRKMKKLLLLLLLLTFNTSAQNSWVRFQVMFDFYGPSESNFFMVSNNNGDTAISCNLAHPMNIQILYYLWTQDITL